MSSGCEPRTYKLNDGGTGTNLISARDSFCDTQSLYPFQQEAAELLSRSDRLYLAFEPGLGKTRTALRAAQLAGAERVAVLCPAIVRPFWRDEAKLVAPDLAVVAGSYNGIVTTPEAMEYFRKWKPDVLILDEAHYLKSPDAKRTKLALKWAASVKQVWPLSGTPMPRNPLELHSVLAALWPSRLIDFEVLDRNRFLMRYCVYRHTEWGIKVVGARNVEELRRLLAPIMIRRTVGEVLGELPEMRWGTINVRLEPADREALLDAERALPERDTIVLEGELPPMSDNLARYRHAVGDLKAPIAAQVIAEELEGGLEKVVVFAYHRSVLDALEEGLQIYGVARIDGSTDPDEREACIKAFQIQHTNHARVFLGQIDACSTGITLTAAHRVFIVEPSWSADVNLQAAKRCHRIGQKDSVLVQFVQIADTLDEALTAQHARETRMCEAVMGHAAQ